MADAVTLKERLKEAEEAYHRLCTGAHAVEIKDQNGEMVKYTPPSATRLAAYIRTLQAQLGQPGCGPMQIWA